MSFESVPEDSACGGHISSYMSICIKNIRPMSHGFDSRISLRKKKFLGSIKKIFICGLHIVAVT